MIRSIDHAVEVQTRRQDARKHSAARIGLAKSIRRYLRRNHPDEYKALRTAIISAAWEIIDTRIRWTL